MSVDEPMVRVRVDLAYDGAPFRGWARQPGLPSVQGAVEDALSLVFRCPCPTVVAGRTDTGVHARRQTLHVDVPAVAWECVQRARAERQEGGPLAAPQDGPGGAGHPHGVDSVTGAAGVSLPGVRRRLNGALNRVLGKDRVSRGWGAATGAVVVQDVCVAPAGFDARFSALSRGYVYRVADAVTGHDPLSRTSCWWVDQELSVPQMHRALQELVGLHDFLSYCKPREGATTVRELQSATVERDHNGTVLVSLTADAFCHHMVRSVVGAAVHVGQGRRASEWPAERLRARARDARIVMAPAHGLVLESVEYPAPELLAERARTTRARRTGS